MDVRRISNYRAKEIIGLLNDNGPLSFKTILKLTNPPMKDRKLHYALSRLLKKGVIAKRNEKIFGGAGTFYQISQDRIDREKAGEIIGCSAQCLEQPEFRYREIQHNEICALWMNAVKSHFPNAEYIRDFQFQNSDLAKKIMSQDLKEMDLKPDVLMILQTTSKDKFISIALEIEKTRKSDKRLIRKLNKYANRSHTDGVIYVCNERRIKNALQHILAKNILHKTRRIEHYPQNFFMFSENVDNPKGKKIYLHNSQQLVVPFVDWVNYLADTSFNQRRDSTINQMGESTAPLI